MVQDTKKYSEAEQMQMILQGTSYAMFVASSDKKKYEKVKSGIEIELTEYETVEMELLTILDKLGYPMDELGTYLYKDVIIEVMDALKNVHGQRRDMDYCKSLLVQLSDAFSHFYHNIAREDKEIGVKSFHLYIQKAISKIDEERSDKKLVKSIYGDDIFEESYGLQAFQIASFALKFYSKESSKESQRPKIKKLSNMPDDVRLKNAL